MRSGVQNPPMLIIDVEHEGQTRSGLIFLDNPENLEPMYNRLKVCINWPLVEEGNLESEV